jgi:predicted Zn-dependent peptidase
MQYYVDLEKRIKAQTPETVLKALTKYIDPKRLVAVVAGDFSGKKVAVGAAESEPEE